MTATKPENILITGASGAIGSALARQYASPGVRLVLLGRNADKLEHIAGDCRETGASVHVVTQDLRQIADLRSWATRLAKEQLPDLVIVNAGMNTNTGPKGEGESWEAIEALLDLNIKSSFALIDALIPAMRRRGSGQIAIISSLAAYYGLPVTPTYCASKAALKSYGEALRGWLAKEDIRVNVVMPGYVRSAMCDEMPGPKPFLWPPEKAARVIAEGLRRNKARITFPFPLNLGTWFLAVLPPSLSQWIVRQLNYGG